MSSRLKIEDIKKEVESKGWKLLSTTYQNLKTDLEFKCPENHTVYLSLARWRKKPECPICKENLSKIKSDVKLKRDKNKHRVLAIDQATITSGYSIFDDEQLIHYGTWTTKGQDHIERVSLTKFWIASLIEKYNPDLVVFEDIQLQKGLGNAAEGVVTYKKLAALLGVLINYVYEKNIPHKVIPPATWRAFSEIKGKTRTEKKKSAQIKVKRLYDISVTQDEADAILLGKCQAGQHKKKEIIKFY